MTTATRSIHKVLISENLAERMPALPDRFPGTEFVQLPLHEGPLLPEYLDAEVMFRSAMPEELFEEILAKADRLSWIQISAAGFDWMGGELFERRVADGLTVTRSDTAHAVPMAEYALGAMLTMARQFPQYWAAQQRREWIRLVGGDFAGRTVGIFGTGSIGRELAWRCTALGAKVIGVSRSGSPTEHFDTVVPSDRFTEILGDCDYVVLAMPLTPETRHMMGTEQFQAMKPTALLVNVGRGALTVESELMAALEAETIAGAAVDVFVDEPLPPDSPWWTTKNALVTPHTSFRADSLMSGLCQDFSTNLERLMRGEPLIGQMKDERLGY